MTSRRGRQMRWLAVAAVGVVLVTGSAWVLVAIGADGLSTATDPATSAAPTAPGAPTTVSAVGGDQQATVSWTAPSAGGGSAVTGYVVTPYIGFASQGPRFFLSTATTQTLSELANGTTYRFRVRAFNAVGVGEFSTVSNPIVPTG